MCKRLYSSDAAVGDRGYTVIAAKAMASMSMLRKAKDFRDRIKVAQGKPQGGSIRTGIRNANRRQGSGGVKAKTGVSLQYKSLRHDPEFEAVLDNIESSSNPVFTSSLNDSTCGSSATSNPLRINKSAADGSGGTEKRSVGEKSPADNESLFPPTDEVETVEERGGLKRDIDPLLGQELAPETDSGHTDSEEDSEENLPMELDPETVNVLESLHLTGGVHSELFEGSPLSSSLEHNSEGVMVQGGGLSKAGGDERGREVIGGNKTTPAVNNESANNNTHVHVHSFEETGETLLINSPDTNSKGVPTSVIPVTSGTGPELLESSGEASTLAPGGQPSLNYLLEHGSAALTSHTYSPHISPHSSPSQEISPSLQTLSNEVENEIFYSVTNQLYPVATSTAGELGWESTSPSLSPSQLPTDEALVQTGSKNQKLDAGKKHGPERADNNDDDLFSDCTTHHLSPVDRFSLEKGGSECRMGRKGGVDVSTSDHPLGHHKEEEEVKEKYSSKLSPAEEEDDLFPDDAKHLQDAVAVEKNGTPQPQNALNITEDYFSRDPGGQHRETAWGPSRSSLSTPPRVTPTASRRSPSRQNSSGKVAPPRPPRSPQLNSRLKLRQQREPGNHPNITSPHEPSTTSTSPPARPQRPEVAVERATVRNIPPLGAVPASIPQKMHQRNVSRKLPTGEIVSPTESLGSSVDPPSTVASSPTGDVSETHKAVTTPQPHDYSTSEPSTSDDGGFLEPPFLPLYIHLLIAGGLYFYYTFNPFVYLAGLMAGFLTFYLVLGAVFVTYVQKEEAEAAAAASADSPAPELSPDFMRSMNIRLEDYENRFVAMSQNHIFKFTATMHYDSATHQRKHRMPCKLALIDGSTLKVIVMDSENEVVLNRTIELRHESCRITIVPRDVFENRKRRWSKKYPIRLEINDFEIFLFANVSRYKQEWFCRLREAAKGTTTKQLIKKQEEFFKYIQQYLPHDPLRPSSHTTGSSYRVTTTTTRSGKHSQKRYRTGGDAVQFSSTSAAKGQDISDGSISISHHQSTSTYHNQLDHSVTSVSSTSSREDAQGRQSVTSVHHSASSGGRQSSAHSPPNSNGTTLTPLMSPPGPPLLETDWINVLAARLCWDVWHEQRWKNWIVSRIQRKLVRIKTPGFLDPLQLTDIDIGDKMPVINRLYEGPLVRVDGVWVFLDVTYEGLFVMTIKTKLKLGQGKKEEEKGREMKSMKHQDSSRHGVSGANGVGHSQAAQVFQDSSVDPDDDSDISEDEEKLKLPNMEDLVIPVLNSGLPEDTQKPLSSPDTNT